MKLILKRTVFTCCIVLFGSSLFAEGLTLKSEEIAGQISMDQVFNGFGCKGNNASPQLEWSSAPKGTKSFAVTMYDPDAPTGSGWWHWLVFDIPSSVTKISSNASELAKLPQGSIESKTDYGIDKFGGACPPKGDKPHTYVLTVYALDVEKLGLDKNATPALVGYMINAHTIQKSSIVAYYKR
jgi:Raf kinase inhibitor-like YbhB/YbcL family protein